MISKLQSQLIYESGNGFLQNSQNYGSIFLLENSYFVHQCERCLSQNPRISITQVIPKLTAEFLENNYQMPYRKANIAISSHL